MATSKKKTGSKTRAVEDIEHEVVPATSTPPAVTQPQEAEVVAAEEDPEKTLALTIAREIKRFGLADAGIEELKKQYGGLTIVDLNDKDGYELVKKAWNDVRGRRTGLEKKGLEIRGSYTKVTKAVKEEEDRLIRLVRPLEDDLYKKWKQVDDEKEAERARKAAEAEAKLQERVQELLDAGAEFKMGYYGLGAKIAIDVATLRELPEEQFGKLKEAVVAAKQEADLEAERLAQQQREESEQREKDRKRLAELEEEQAASRKAKRELRLDLLDAVGMSISAGGKEVAYDNGFASHRIPMEQVEFVDDAAFKELVKTAKVKVAEAKLAMETQERLAAQEREALEKKKVLVNEVMVEAGLIYAYNTETFTFRNDVVDLKRRMDELVKLDEEEVRILGAEMADIIREGKKEQAARDHANKVAAEKQRKALLGDAVNFTEYVNQVLKVELPELESETYKAKLAGFYGGLDNLAKMYLPEEEAVPS